MSTQPHPRWVLRPRVPEEVYTDRQEFLDYFYKAALAAIERRTMSTVLLGTRRMGKTEIFKRVVNRLFWEQDHQDPHAAVPVYYSFQDEILDRWEFAIEYVENFIRWYAAFRLRDPQLLSSDFVSRQALPEFIRAHLKVPTGFSGTLKFIETLQKKDVTIPEKAAVTAPVRVSDYDDCAIVMFLDEFQNTRLPQHTFSIVGFMQDAVESNACPHFVTGSVMSILSREIIGRGSLFGRFRSKPIEAMTNYWGAELALKAARYYQAHITEEMAPIVAERCGGNPFYITAVIQQAAEQGKMLQNEETLNEMLAVDLSSGFIWGELNDQVSRWIERINDYGITKWILYLSALEEGDRLDLERIQRELREREGKDVPIDTIREVLIKLSRGDLLQYMELGGWFRKVEDPILLEFLKVWGKIEVEGQPSALVQDDLLTRCETLQRRYHEYKGYLGEVYMSQVLLSGTQKTFPGHVFHVDDDITMPWRFSYVHHRVRLGSGTGKEIDLFGAAGSEVWICQSKWWTQEKVGMEELQEFLAQGEQVQAERTPRTLRLWLFAYRGLTGKAQQCAREQGILWSTKTELNELLRLLGLRELPEL